MSATRRTVITIGLALWAWGGWAAAPLTQTVTLQPAKGPGLSINFNFRSDKGAAHFEKEPPAQGKELVRGRIPTIPPTPFLRNVSDNELFVNTEHQPDFVTGKFDTYRSKYLGHVIFSNMRVSTIQEGLEIPYILEMITYEHGGDGWFWINSGWSGPLNLGGPDWRLGVVDNLDGQIGKEDTLYLVSPQPARADLTITIKPPVRSLFLEGHAFDLGFAFKPAVTGAVLEATLTETQPPLGQLNISAQGCTYVCLRNEQSAVVLKASSGTVSAPAGTYQVADCLLEPGPRLMRKPAFVSSPKGVSIEPGQTASLRAGLPLRNTLQVERDGNQLHFTYQVLGAGGEQYDFYNRTNRPVFSIYKGSLRIAQGTLPFG